MLYVDYNFDLNDNVILLDEDLKLSGHENGKAWGNLPESWKEGDMFRLITGANGRVTLLKVAD